MITKRILDVGRKRSGSFYLEGLGGYVIVTTEHSLLGVLMMGSDRCLSIFSSLLRSFSRVQSRLI